MTQNDGSNNTFSIIAGLVGGYLAIGLVFVGVQYIRCGGAWLFLGDTNKYLSALNIMLYWPLYFLRMGIHWACTGYS
jgi:hypothetical protein